MTDQTRPRGGELLTAISNSVVRILREHYGRGPMKAKTYVLDDMVVCVLREGGYMPFEQTMVDTGGQQKVVDMRRDLQVMIEPKYRTMIEELTGRRVLAFMSQVHLDPELTLEVFLLDGPVDGGYGAVEVTELPKDVPEPPAT